MKTLLSLLALLAGCGGCVSIPAPSMAELQAKTLRLYAVGLESTAVCSGTATGPAELTTAKHCVEGMALKTVNGQPVEPVSIRYVGMDEAVVTFAAPRFKTWAKRGPAPKVGERIRYWGNPLGIPNVYRVGVVVSVTDKIIAVQATVCHGDSGAALWNDRGEMVGVLILMEPEQIKCAFAVGQR